MNASSHTLKKKEMKQKRGLFSGADERISCRNKNYTFLRAQKLLSIERNDGSANAVSVHVTL